MPLGSILGPLLFNLFINYITSIQNCKIILFADDAVIYVTANTFLETIDILNKVIKCLDWWLKLNKLIVNTTKTKIMLFSPCL